MAILADQLIGAEEVLIVNKSKKIPVIIDSDIGTDIDDTWALVMALNSPELDIKLIVSATGDSILRAKIIAKLLEAGGRSDIPIGIGIPLEGLSCDQAPWVAGYELEDYPGQIIEDGVGAIVDTIMESPEQITLVCIGPLPNIAAALRRQPEISRKARFVGMHGSIRRGYSGSAEISAEFNVVRYPFACREVFSAPWNITITPLDTCGLVELKGEKYQVVRNCKTALAQALMDNYQVWTQHYSSGDHQSYDPDEESSVLFDTVAIYLAFAEEFLEMEQLGIRVTDDGYTLLDEDAAVINCAIEWRDLDAFEDFLVRRLT
jgi:inosine-uridine nucleoside N-ribohydrolase